MEDKKIYIASILAGGFSGIINALLAYTVLPLVINVSIDYRNFQIITVFFAVVGAIIGCIIAFIVKKRMLS